VASATKFGFVKKVRAASDAVLLRLPLPKVNPNLVSALSIASSIGFIITVKNNPVLGWMLLLATLTLDVMDGLIARKHHLATEDGYFIDLVSDRASEAIIFTHELGLWYPLVAINLALTQYSVKTGRHIILPLRHIYLLTLTLKLL